jgi:hypothetical protein
MTNLALREVRYSVASHPDISRDLSELQRQPGVYHIPESSLSSQRNAHKCRDRRRRLQVSCNQCTSTLEEMGRARFPTYECVRKPPESEVGFRSSLKMVVEGV